MYPLTKDFWALVFGALIIASVAFFAGMHFVLEVEPKPVKPVVVEPKLVVVKALKVQSEGKTLWILSDGTVTDGQGKRSNVFKSTGDVGENK